MEARRRAAQLLVRHYVSQAHAQVRQRELAALSAIGTGARGGAGGRALANAGATPGAAASAAGAAAGGWLLSPLLRRGLKSSAAAGRAAAAAAADPKTAASPSPLLLLRRLRSTLADAATFAPAAEARAAAAAAAAAASIATTSALTTHPATRLAAASLPHATRRHLALWLAGCAAWTFSMVVLGGATRLTRSGLSMTDWRFAFERPPLTDADWEAEFAKYRASPEYRLLHSGMSVADFKFIYGMEWAHRMWGRLLGLGFALPLAYFAARGAVNGPLAARLGLLLCMGGAQGLVGWWMVRSGLKEPAAAVADASDPSVVAGGSGGCQQVPRVSPYRLAAHLTSAFAIYATLVWTSLSLWQPVPLAATAAGAVGAVGAAAAAGPASATSAAAAAAVAAAAAALRRRALPLAALVGVTAVSGAFVAGLDAGHAYNTFPMMNGAWVPPEYWGEQEGGGPRLPWWRNAFENTAAVQLHHRALAVSTLASATGVWLAHRSLPLPRAAGSLLAAAAAVTCAQAGLGIATLLTYVPPTLGTMHQAGALSVFTVLLALLHAVRPPHPSALARAAGRLAPPLALAGTAAVATAVVTQY